MRWPGRFRPKPLLTKLYCAPGQCRHRARWPNACRSPPPTLPPWPEFAAEQKIDFAVIGADAQLVGGLVGCVGGRRHPRLGPSTRPAAVLEGSKGFVKDLCAETGIPTAAYHRFTRRPRPPKPSPHSLGYPVVIKADGLAAGKGVIIADRKARQTDKAIDFMFEGGFGDCGP